MTFRLTYRALLTETLPYEVPVIFSNERLYASILAMPSQPQARQIVEKMRSKLDNFTVPYQYAIRKDEKRTTNLAIIHPNYQVSVSKFYDHYHQSIITYCGRSKLSLRRPVDVVDIFTANKLSRGHTLKLGVPHIEASDGETEAGHITSYFAYSRFNLLGRYVESKEFRDLELRFPVLRTIDISKCFAHIYTHSVTWASKGKEYAKQNAETHSFEGRFDRLMQGANYNETNGIVIGPEVSRLFAEIILQDVDLDLVRTAAPLVLEEDYCVRRYVDDYFIFARSIDVADQVQSSLERSLEHYKLFLNNAKTETSHRPFVTKISLARSEVADLLAALHASLDDLPAAEPKIAARKAKAVAKQVITVRLICERHGVSMSAVGGWFMAQLRVLLRRALSAVKSAEDEVVRDTAEDIASSLVDAAFYVCAIDLRVRSTYNLCQFIATISQFRGPTVVARQKRLMHRVELGLEQLISQASRNAEGESVELQNLLITGAYLLGDRFLNIKAVIGAIDGIMAAAEVTYFEYVAVKFCLLKAPGAFADRLNRLNAMVASKVQTNAAKLGRHSELYLLACDYLSAPDVSHAEKKLVLSKLVGGDEPSAQTIDVVAKHIGLVDWSGLRIQHLLARKELRPVYAWA